MLYRTGIVFFIIIIIIILLLSIKSSY